jgi:hypothetical protein
MTISYEDLERELNRLGDAFPNIDAWINHRGFVDDDLSRWLVETAENNFAVGLIMKLQRGDVEDLLDPIQGNIMASSHGLLVGLSVGYELGYRDGRGRRP